MPHSLRVIRHASRREATINYKIVGLVELLSGAWSAVATLTLLSRFGGVVQNAWFAFIALGFSTMVGAAGVLLVRGREAGEILSYTVQLLQLVQVTVGAFAIRFLAGPNLTIFYLGGGEFHAYVGMASGFNVLRGSGDPPFALGLNLVAAGALLMLLGGRHHLGPTAQPGDGAAA